MVIFMYLPSDEEIEAFENSVLGQAYRFTDRALIREALQGPSIFNHSGQKTLALVGDATLRQFLVDQGRERNKTPGKSPLP
jgi:ribonuclease-3